MQRKREATLSHVRKRKKKTRANNDEDKEEGKEEGKEEDKEEGKEEEKEQNVIHHIIGEGAYGCVHSPSLHCTRPLGPHFNYEDHVSKIMKTSDAQKEFDEFALINQLDRREAFHTGMPVLCKPDLQSRQAKRDIRACDQIQGDIDKHPQQYSLLLMKDGGLDLSTFQQAGLSAFAQSQRRVDLFWLEAHRLLRGLHFFRQHQVVHNDIKPRNIVFDPDTMTLKYIDFGLMRSKRRIVDLSEHNDNFLGVFFWSLPLECGFMNQHVFQRYVRSSPARRHDWETQLTDLIVANSDDNLLAIPISKPESFAYLFAYVNPQNNEIPSKRVQRGHIAQFFDSWNRLLRQQNNHYPAVLNHIADSIDVFGLGVTLAYMLTQFGERGAFTTDQHRRLSRFFHSMWTFETDQRTTDTRALMNQYEDVLRDNGVLRRLNVVFDNNMPVRSSSSSSSFPSVPSLSSPFSIPSSVSRANSLKTRRPTNSKSRRSSHSRSKKRFS